MKGGMTVEKKNMSALLGGLANKSEKNRLQRKRLQVAVQRMLQKQKMMKRHHV